MYVRLYTSKYARARSCVCVCVRVCACACVCVRLRACGACACVCGVLSHQYFTQKVVIVSTVVLLHDLSFRAYMGDGHSE